MPSLAQTVAGSTFSVSASLPVSEVSASYVALSYTAVAEVTDIGSIGKDFSVVSHNPVGDRKTYKFKGSYNTGSITLKMAKAISDAGQILLLAAQDSDNDYTFKITLQDARDMFFRGKVMSFVTNIGSVNNILGADVKIELTSDIFETV